MPHVELARLTGFEPPPWGFVFLSAPATTSWRSTVHNRLHGQATYGFLYIEYGPTAWWWEVEELVRKLLLSSLVVLIDAGSPLQVSAFSQA